MNALRCSIALILATVLPSATGLADVGFERDELERYQQAMDRLWDDAYDSSPHYAAIAYSPKTGKYGYSHSFTSLAATQRRAIGECKGKDAKIVVWVEDGYCALALGKDGSYGAAWANTIAQAKAAALRNCKKHTDDCRIVVCVSAMQ